MANEMNSADDPHETAAGNHFDASDETSSDEQEIAALLEQLASGVDNAADQLMPLVYDRLRGLAQKMLRNESPSHHFATNGVGERGLHSDARSESGQLAGQDPLFRDWSEDDAADPRRSCSS